jgi:hypothetical protein
MGVICVMVLANRDEAKQIGSATDCPDSHNRWPALDVKGTDWVTLSTLYAISLDRAWEETDLDRFPVLYQHSDEGPWIALVADDLMATLAAADQDRRSELARAWDETEELQDWEAEDVAERVEELCRFAQQSKETGKQMLLYVCL